MSKETSEWLNTKIMVGNGLKPWWFNESLSDDGMLYSGAIPAADVVEKLFNFELEAWKIKAYDPAKGMGRSFTDSSRTAIVRPPGALGPDDKGAVGYYGGATSYKIHQYRDWLLDNVATILGDGVAISSAGLLAGGFEAFVSVSLESVQRHAGVEYLPTAYFATSGNGKLSTQGGACVTLPICDNTLGAGIGEAVHNGSQVKVRHSANSLTIGTRDRFRSAFGLLTDAGDAFNRQVEVMTNTPVDADQWAAFKTAYAGDISELEGRARSFAETAHAALQARWEDHDPMVALWSGTAFGALQAANTYAHHDAIRRGGLEGRVSGNLREAITGGWTDHDDAVLTALLKAGIPVPVGV
jgi:phage/plasmid-like protein (TIGR03299 family)